MVEERRSEDRNRKEIVMMMRRKEMERKETTRFHEIYTRRTKKKKFLWSSFLSQRKVVCNLVVKNFLADEKAQSITLGFVIILGIVLSASVILLSMQIPEQTRKFEFEHAAKIPRDFAELGSTIDMAALSEDPTAYGSCAIGMAAETVPFLGIHAAGGTLSFNQSSERFECIAAAPGEPVVTGSGCWNSTPVDFCSYPSENKYHVDTFPVAGAKLQLETGGDRIYNSGGEEYLSGEFWFNNFSVTNNTTLYTPWLTVHAKDITIGQNSSINATGWGLAGGKTLTDSPWSDPGKGEGGGEKSSCDVDYGGCLCGAGGGGAGHYSAGGDGGNSSIGNGPCCSGCTKTPPNWYSGGQGGSAYENVTNTSKDMNTTDAGSGGACGAWGQVAYSGIGNIYYIYEGGAGGDGGGVIHLDAPTISIMGNVSVDGEKGHYSNDEDKAEDSAGGGGGGGSGGTILIKGGNITISGKLSAKGGDGAGGAKSCDNVVAYDTYDSNGGGGGGSGGIIKIFYGINLSAPGGIASHTNVNGGAGGLGGVGNGTYCSDSHHPAPGGDGSPGGDGLVYTKSYPEYVESIPHYSSGYLLSSVTDAGHNATTGADTSMIRYGNISWTETTPPGTSIVMKVRTSTNASMTGAMAWESCPEVANGTDISDLSSASDGHRYVQWRAELYTFERFRTPILHSVNVSYEYGMPVLVNSSGSIVFKSQYIYLPNYKLVYAHGATVKNQTKGEFMLHHPPISISRSNQSGVTSLAISSVNLTGESQAVSGVFSSAVKTSFRKSDLLTGGLLFHNITLNITTEYPAAWRNWFNDTCEEAGLEYTDTNSFAPGNYNINENGNTLQIIFYGNETRPVNLWLKRAEVEVGIEK